ncbi:hypothetical protein JCM4814A_31760 [Streptomyces phaeofaciens JCM 4814]|uniref:AG1 protein n=1 Tax=Streptomyces phaeofaciens TaxID=68254 RepID=A0A918HK06_9ACTN|nr:hypothetical protein [Streptomyces phaeofaciens]GGT66732.1 hypothetical protein GCM10010226_50520 [Streptomyces phaeofaciens]
MAWDEWEQLKSEAAADSETHMRLNQLDPGSGPVRPAPDPGQYGDLKVNQQDLAKIGTNAFKLYNDLWDKGRRAVPTSESAAGKLTTAGFALGGALQHVALRWDEQLGSLRDACAHISNHMTVTKKLHSGDDHYIRRQMSSIDLLDAGFDERVGEPGKQNPVYGEKDDKKGKKD